MEQERYWKRIKLMGEDLKKSSEKTAHILTGVIAAYSSDSCYKDTEELERLKEELENLSMVQVSEYEPDDSEERRIEIFLPNQKNKSNDYEKTTYTMGDEARQNSLEIICGLNSFRKKIRTVERDFMPGEPTSCINNGMASEIMEDIDDFSNMILDYLNCLDSL